jgi:hypothetical protein
MPNKLSNTVLTIIAIAAVVGTVIVYLLMMKVISG